MVHPLIARLVTTALSLLAILLAAAPAAAHNGHAALPDGFRASVTSYVDAQGRAADLPGIDFVVAEGGIGLTVTNTTSRVVEVTGEQAGEPLVRVTADRAAVNQASPQAADVEGATVDRAAAAELLDLVWQRAPADWVALPRAGTVTVLDHRGAPGHAPVRSDYDTGDVAAEFGIDFTVDGTPYRALGAITAVEPAGGSSRLPVLVVAALVILSVLGLWLRASSARRPASRISGRRPVASRQ